MGTYIYTFYPSARWARIGVHRLRRCRRTQPFGYYTNMMQLVEFIIYTNIQPPPPPPGIFLPKVKVIGQRSRSKIKKNLVNAIT